MRIAVSLVLSLCLLSAVRAASPEDDYLASRDRTIAAMKRLETAKADQKKIEALQNKATADLEKRLAAILGPLGVTGFPAVGKLNLESFSAGDVGFQMLDGLAYAGGEADPRVVVTTTGLLARWLHDRAAQKDVGSRLPAEVNAALALDSFYTQAINSDAGFTKTLDLPIVKAAGVDFEVAMLGGWAQDIGPNPNQAVIVAIGKGGKAYFVDAPAGAATPKIAECDAVWDAATKESERLQKIYQDSKLKDEKSFEKSREAENEGDADYRACMAERLPKQPVFPALVKRAQDLADRFAGK